MNKEYCLITGVHLSIQDSASQSNGARESGDFCLLTLILFVGFICCCMS